MYIGNILLKILIKINLTWRYSFEDSCMTLELHDAVVRNHDTACDIVRGHAQNIRFVY